MCDGAKATPAYEQNLVNLIHSVRKEFNAPKLPFVIAEFSGPWLATPWGKGWLACSRNRRS